MITGVVSGDLDARILVVVRGPAGQGQRIEAVVDTGFNGWLTLPPAEIATLTLPWRHSGRAILADGSEVVADMHEGALLWEGALVRIAIDAAESVPLIGMSLLHGYELAVQVIEGGRVIIRSLP